MCFRILGFPEGALFHKGLSWISLCKLQAEVPALRLGRDGSQAAARREAGRADEGSFGVGFGVQGPGIAVQGRIMVWGLRAGKA